MGSILSSFFSSTPAGSDVLGWADSILEKHRDRRAIIVSHSLLKLDETFGYQGQATYDVLKDHPNFFMMLCGHVLGEALREDTYNGSRVYSLLSDYQGRERGGDGWLRIMKFSPAQNRIHVSTYSPTLAKYERDADSQFTLELRHVIRFKGGRGTATVSVLREICSSVTTPAAFVFSLSMPSHELSARLCH